MQTLYKPLDGDHVRVVYEAEVSDADHEGFAMRSEEGGNDVPIFFNDHGLVSIEKLEPPVEVFKPGDVVRSIERPENVYALGYKQYLAIGPKNTLGQGQPHEVGEFTSKHYELVASV